MDLIRGDDLAAFVSIINEHPTVVRMQHPFGTWLHVAADKGRLEFCRVLVDNGANVNDRTSIRGGNPLDQAASSGRIDVVKYLASAGCDLDVDEPTRNPLFGAISGGHIDVVRFLIGRGVDAGIRYSGENMSNMGAVEFAEERGQNEIAAYLRSCDKCA